MFQFVIVQELDVMELEKRYWTLKSGTKTGKFDLETFTSLVSPPIPQCLCPGINECFICIGIIIQLRVQFGNVGFSKSFKM